MKTLQKSKSCATKSTTAGKIQAEKYTNTKWRDSKINTEGNIHESAKYIYRKNRGYYFTNIDDVASRLLENPNLAYSCWSPSEKDQETLLEIQKKFGQSSMLPSAVSDMSAEKKQKLSSALQICVPLHVAYENLSKGGYSSVFGNVAQYNYEHVALFLELGVPPNGPAGNFWEESFHPLIDQPMMHRERHQRIDYGGWMAVVHIFLGYGFDLNARIAEEGSLCYHPVIAENLLPAEIELFLSEGFNPHLGMIKGESFLHQLETNLFENSDLIKLCQKTFENFPSAITASATPAEIQAALKNYHDPQWESF
eukprot:TRINITY_DN2142_c0_g2_i2.p1 TRINITY_DN2142_c0_g2~~TRINITY_DN2142_c0_g2_i2.p1  ORF type:complete len:362 (-),score=56.57 TRINITY_DN2142_c0_g2_i2:230-1159(-)